MKKTEAKALVSQLNEENYEPTDWEHNFIESILNSKYDTLTEKQAACLRKIYEKATNG